MRIIAEECAMNIEPFAKIVITAIHHIAIWLKVHQSQHFVAVVANHLAVPHAMVADKNAAISMSGNAEN